MDEIDEEARAAKVRAPKTGANWTVIWFMCTDYTEQKVAMCITVVHQTANRGRQIHVTVLLYWMIGGNRKSEFHIIQLYC